MAAKTGIEYPELDTYLHDASASEGWALCVGAGISLPMFPDWGELTELLVEEIDDNSADVSSQLLNEFSPDALFQAARDRLGLDPEEFSSLLSEKMYSKIREDLSDEESSVVFRALKADDPSYASSDRRWPKFLKIMDDKYDDVSAVKIARTIVDVIDTDREPKSILSFNAETLLFSLCNAYLWQEYQSEHGHKRSGVLTQPKKIDLITQSISTQGSGRIPYYMCHGLLPVPGKYDTKWLDATGKLVFSEGQYLNLANNSFSWQSSAFLNTCSSVRVVFVGLSMSDHNMRKWLSWVHQNRRRELEMATEYEGGASTQHFWIKKKPGSESLRRWIESSVSHLGIRLIWIDEWSQVGPALRQMLGLNDAEYPAYMNSFPE